MTFTCPQALGNDGTNDLWLTGVDLNEWKLTDFTLSYDESNQSYTFTGLALINKDTKSPNYTVWYFSGCKLTKVSGSIDSVEAAETGRPKAIYNLQGMPVSGELQNGQIYIIDGKKVLIRK